MINILLRIAKVPLTGNKANKAVISIIFACASGFTGASSSIEDTSIERGEVRANINREIIRQAGDKEQINR